MRGKYSGDCVSCNAKWSKCWYIASVDNKPEWETRLGISIIPCDDEVCFQCWDGKIRTSPKRKQTKLEVEITPPEPGFNPSLQDNTPQQSPTLTLSQNDIRLAAISLKSSGSDQDSPWTSTSSMEASPRGTNKRPFEESGSSSEVGETTTEEQNPTKRTTIGGATYRSEVDSDGDSMSAEHEAVFLLSTAFRTFPSGPSIS